MDGMGQQAKGAREELKKAQAVVKQLEKEKRLAQSALVNQEHDTEREVRGERTIGGLIHGLWKARWS